MMKYTVIGLGYFGKIIVSKLKDGIVNTVDTMNKNATYTTISDVPYNDGYWFVVTPASTHYKVIKELVDKGVQNIWVEKPLCSLIKDTREILKLKPDIYCDYTWLKHSMVQTIYKYKDTINHLSLKWLNDGTHIPTDVSIVSDLVIHPLSIITNLLGDIKSVYIVFNNSTTIIVSGKTEKGTFTIEVSNDSLKKCRTLSAYCHDTTLRWSQLRPNFIENHGEIILTDAIEENIKAFKRGETNKDISETLEKINEMCQ